MTEDEMLQNRAAVIKTFGAILGNSAKIKGSQGCG
jgi:hypothetical protein